MKKLLVLFGISFISLSFAPIRPSFSENLPDEIKFPALLPEKTKSTNLAVRLMDSVYNRINLSNTGLKKDIFYSAYKGYQHLMNEGKIRKPDILTIIDYSQSSKNKRLYIINLRTGKLLYHTYVSHGKNSGQEYATSFSNAQNSNKSSLGFMVTGDTYVGRAGFSLRLFGMENRYNSNVFARGVVMHGSDYVNQNRADEGANMGRSWGCPAVPQSLSRDIINLLKGGSCMFVYANDKDYARSSSIMNAKVSWPELREMVEKENAKLLPSTAVKDNTNAVDLNKMLF